MTFATIINIDAIKVRLNQDVIRADEFSTISEVSALVDACKNQLLELTVRAKNSVLMAEQDGYRNGFKSGELAASQLIIDTEIKINKYLIELENTVVDLALQIVRRLSIKVGNETIVSGLAIEAIKAFRGQSTFHIKVNPKNKEKILEYINMLNDDKNLQFAYQVSADPQIDLLDCVIESPVGTVKTGLEQQLKLIETAMKRNPEESVS